MAAPRKPAAAKSAPKKSGTRKPATTGPLAPQRYSWRKLSAAKWADSWWERLSFLGPTRVMIIEFPNAPKVRIEAHGLKKAEADDLLKMFGGQVTEAKWLTLENPPMRAPIRIRERLLVVSTEKELEDARAERARRAVLLIPAGMAFGTGEHETTVTCLRLLADVSDELEPGAWEALDLGTGTGILAIAARVLGASKAEAHDFDPHAVRTAKENVKLNATTKLAVKRMDVRKWTPDRQWQVVIANLFSGLLIESAATIAKASAPGGHLIFSGVLREQEKEVVAAFEANGFAVQRVVRRSKWIAGRAVRAERKPRASAKRK
jgi:ribosomal protein L11 methyltransferase